MKSLWKLFLVSAFPIHVWAILMVLMDFEWIRDQTSLMDSIGVFAYALLIALFESILLLVISLVISLLLPPTWKPNNRLAGLTWIILVISFWAAADQLYYIWGEPIPVFFLNWMIASGHPARILFATFFPLLVLSASVPLLLIHVNKKATSLTLTFVDRIGTLSVLYLFFDLAGLIIVIYRNLIT